MRMILYGIAGLLGGMTLGFVAIWAGALLWEGVFGYHPRPGPDDHSAMNWLLVGMGIGGVVGALWLGRLARTERGAVAAILFAILGIPALLYLLMVIGGIALNP